DRRHSVRAHLCDDAEGRDGHQHRTRPACRRERPDRGARLRAIVVRRARCAVAGALAEGKPALGASEGHGHAACRAPADRGAARQRDRAQHPQRRARRRLIAGNRQEHGVLGNRTAVSRPSDVEARMTTTRRRVLQGATATMLAMPFVRGAHAAGRLSVGFWDHWVPGANAPLGKLCREWAGKEKVDITVDFITSTGDKDLLTAAAEAQAKTGHDIMQLTAWYAPGHAASLDPVDDVMAELIKEHGPVNSGAEYLGKQDGHWVAVPTSYGSTLSPPCARIDLMKEIVGLDVTKMYPAGAPPDKELIDKWNWDFFSEAAGKAKKAGYAFGMPMSTTSDAVQWVGSIFNSY